MATIIGPRQYTYADLERLPENRKRSEIIEGDLIVSPFPSVLHQKVVGSLFVQVHAFAPKVGGQARDRPLWLHAVADDRRPHAYRTVKSREPVVSNTRHP